jgi:hypothetical protein
MIATRHDVIGTKVNKGNDLCARAIGQQLLIDYTARRGASVAALTNSAATARGDEPFYFEASTNAL